MKKLYFLSVCIFLLAFPAFSQVQLTQYFLDGTLYNPAFAGSQEAICANVYGRHQWLGLADANGNKISPRSGVFNFNAPIYAINSGLGLNVIYDKTGFEQTLGVKLNYAYRIRFNEQNSLGIGLAFSLSGKSIDFSQLILEQPGDPLLKTRKKESGIIPDIDFGVQYLSLIHI